MVFVRTQLFFVLSLSVLPVSGSHAVQTVNEPVYPQYSEAACSFIAEQIDHFKHQPHWSSYQNAARNYARHCLDPQPLTKPSTLVARSVVGQAEHDQPHAKSEALVAVAAEISSLKKVDQDVSIASREMLIWLVLSVAVLLTLRSVFRFYIGSSDSERQGRRADQQLTKHLVDALSEGYCHYHNLLLKTEQGEFTAIDHLITSPYGLFVIEVKNYKGWIFGAEHQAHWGLRRFKRMQSFQNPLRQNEKRNAALAHMLDIDLKTKPSLIYSILAISSRAKFKTEMPDNVMYIGQVLRYFDKICEQGRPVNKQALRRYNAKLNLLAKQAVVLRSEHKSQLER